ncbi:MAG: hypothetical protein LBQ45_00370 [Mycoplasmataceae bacterium]|jgi:hypothetical protein|nr:hypothetical protein [Mycoplasmataceae bacterium]
MIMNSFFAKGHFIKYNVTLNPHDPIQWIYNFKFILNPINGLWKRKAEEDIKTIENELLEDFKRIIKRFFEEIGDNIENFEKKIKISVNNIVYHQDAQVSITYKVFQLKKTKE